MKLLKELEKTKLKDDKLKDHKFKFTSKFPHEKKMSMKT
jgi:hypothetical protein